MQRTPTSMERSTCQVLCNPPTMDGTAMSPRLGGSQALNVSRSRLPTPTRCPTGGPRQIQISFRRPKLRCHKFRSRCTGLFRDTKSHTLEVFHTILAGASSRSRFCGIVRISLRQSFDNVQTHIVSVSAALNLGFTWLRRFLVPNEVAAHGAGRKSHVKASSIYVPQNLFSLQ